MASSYPRGSAQNPMAPPHWVSKRVTRYNNGVRLQAELDKLNLTDFQLKFISSSRKPTAEQKKDIADAVEYWAYIDRTGKKPPPPLGPTVTTSSSGTSGTSSGSSSSSLNRDAASDSGQSGTTNLSRESTTFVPSTESEVDSANEDATTPAAATSSGISPYVWVVGILALAGGALFGAKKMGYL